MRWQNNCFCITPFKLNCLACTLVLLLTGCQTEESHYPSDAPKSYIQYQDWAASLNSPILFDSELEERLSSIANSLALVSAEPEDKYSIRILNTGDICYCSVGAGHNIYISTAMLKLTDKDEGEIAALIAHEIGHAISKDNVHKAYADIEHQQRARAIEFSIIIAGIVAGGVTYAALNNAANKSGGPASNLSDSQIRTAEGIAAGSAIASGAIVFGILSSKPAASAGRRALSFLNHNYTLRQEYAADNQALMILGKAGYLGQPLTDILEKLDLQQNLSKLPGQQYKNDLGLRIQAIDSQLNPGFHRK